MASFPTPDRTPSSGCDADDPLLEESPERLAEENHALRQASAEQAREAAYQRARADAAENLADEFMSGLLEFQHRIEVSLSWRLTRPLRSARVLLRRLPMGRRAWRRWKRSELHLRREYRSWLKGFGTLTDEQREEVGARVESLNDRPLISVVMPVCDPDPELLAETIASVRAQLYPEWELCVADDASTNPRVGEVLREAARLDPRVRVVTREARGHISVASNSALELARGEFVAFLDHDDLLAPHALFCLAREIRSADDVGLVYSDEDKLDDRGRRESPHFKPAWNQDLLRSYNYVCHLHAIRTSLVREAGGLREGYEGAQDRDLVLRCGERLRPEQIRHVPLVLYHWRKSPGSMAASADAKPYAIGASIRAVRDHLERCGVEAEVSESTLQPGTLRLRYALPDPPPLVSVVVLTRDGRQLLQTCVESFRAHTDYRPYELLIVDNGSEEPETLDYLRRLEADGVARVVQDPQPFNFSALNNNAVREHARGEVVLLLNNDTELTSPGWLTELVSHAMRPEVGAVGPKLLYPDGRIQHAGVVLGIGGVAGHLHQGAFADEAGYMARLRVAQGFSALTAACLAIRRETYLQVGGFEEQGVAVAFGDIDFCLRVRAQGYQNVYTPFAELVHHESATRGTDLEGENHRRFLRESEFMYRRWGNQLRHDPAYSPNLTLEGCDAALARPPRATLSSLYLSSASR